MRPDDGGPHRHGFPRPPRSRRPRAGRPRDLPQRRGLHPRRPALPRAGAQPAPRQALRPRPPQGHGRLAAPAARGRGLPGPHRERLVSRIALSQTNPLGVNRAEPLSPVSQLQVNTLQRVFEHLSEGLVLANLAGELVHWNRAAITMHGLGGAGGELLPAGELVTSYQLEELDGRVLPLSDWPLMRTIRGETVKNVDLRMRRLDRPFDRIFSYGGSLVFDERGQPQLAVVHITDITARVEAEQSLARELARHALLLQCSQRLLDPVTGDAPLVEQLFALVSGHLQADIMFHFRLDA
ncbi:MAG: PAS domain-containing protein, partial [Myxococcales bacterium]